MACKRTPEQTYRYNRTAYCKAKFGLTPSEYDALIGSTDRCEICREPFTTTLKPNVDHNHETGEVRGVLCGKCNKGIGLLKDDPDVLSAAIEYLNDKGSYGIVRRRAPQGNAEAPA